MNVKGLEAMHADEFFLNDEVLSMERSLKLSALLEIKNLSS